MIRLLGLALALSLFAASVQAQHWTYPGDVYTHLRMDHGVDASGMSYEQAASLHDSLHEGRSRSRGGGPIVMQSRPVVRMRPLVRMPILRRIFGRR
jgi:hypothetical protein